MLSIRGQGQILWGAPLSQYRDVVVWLGESGVCCALCYFCCDFQYPAYLRGTFWGWL